MKACGGEHWLVRKCADFYHQVHTLCKSNKNDFIAYAVIVEAASRPSMRFVAVKSEEAQVMLYSSYL
ncbi:hypothetical protein [Photobacterium leiognathi]|uniref:hypothetical protein n=1 Tax=Photobacterium leiognathi TaxID=553611 RepID=UPI000C026701|nr:hypothetical protein [Photobacterium leiognathi]PHZ58703.1 hypothetical protein CRG86_013000 [Photobacterium leiognathi]PSW46030.1 hypothetical protein C0W40_02435 [Photobacterium leiognathi subsp. mandapamensis]